jgi:hypothetical protein
MLLRRNAKAVLGVVGFATFAVIVVLEAVGFAAFAVIVYDRGQSYNLFRRESLLAALSTLGADRDRRTKQTRLSSTGGTA